MSEQLVEKKSNGLKKLVNSVIGVLVGVALFFASFGVLYWNEEQVDISTVATESVEIPATGITGVETGKFVSTTGLLTSTESLGDRPYLEPGDHIALKRTVEMFAWQEGGGTDVAQDTGESGSNTDIKDQEAETVDTDSSEYTYSRGWIENPPNSDRFGEPQGHLNPTKSIESKKRQVTLAQVGDYRLDMSKLDYPLSEPLNLTSSVIPPASRRNLSGNYLYFGAGSLESPRVGDLRISYLTLNQNIRATVFGELSDNKRLSFHKTRKNIPFYRLFTTNRAQAIASLSSKSPLITWGLRIAGFLMMWLGLYLFADPLHGLFDAIPVIGFITRKAAGIGTLMLAAALSSLTIVVTFLFHTPIMIFFASGLCIFILLRLAFRRKKPADSAA